MLRFVLAALLGFAAVSALAACGSHFELPITALTASRAIDDVVTAKVTLTCKLVGVDACETEQGTLCAEATFTGPSSTADAGGAQAGSLIVVCTPKTLKEGESVTIELESSASVPKNGAVTVRSLSGGGGSIEDLNRTVAVP